MKHLAILLLFVPGLCFAGNDSLLTDTTIFFHELKFENELEQSVFEARHKGQTNDLFALFYVAGENTTLKALQSGSTRFKTMIKNLEASTASGKNEAKKIKYIYGKVHAEFFRKYELKNGFNEIFEGGNYNCVSATALFSMVMEEMKIPYSIKVIPSHVYLVAYPKDQQILIETTDPVQGYFEYDQKFQQKYVDHLVRVKTVRNDEVMNKGYEAIFNEYFFSQEDVSLLDLAGLQYFNKGLYQLDESDEERAAVYMEKALYLYPSPKIAWSLITVYAGLLKNADYGEEKHVDYLIRLLRYDQLIAENDIFVSEFDRLTNNCLLKKNDTTYYTGIYNRLIANTTNEEIKHKFSLIFYMNMAQVHSTNLEYAKSERFVKKAIELEPENRQILNDYVVTLLRYAESFHQKELALEQLNKAENEIAGLFDSQIYIAYKSDIYANLMARTFAENKRTMGEGYRVQLEELLNKGVNNNILINNVAIAYANAASCYYRMGSKEKAKSLLHKGLEYAPNNYELQSRLNMIR